MENKYQDYKWSHPWYKEVQGLGLETELTQTLHGICQFTTSTNEGYISTLKVYSDARWGFLQALLGHLKKNDVAKWNHRKLKTNDLKLFLAHLRQQNYIDHIDTSRDGKVRHVRFSVNIKKIMKDYLDKSSHEYSLFDF